MKEKEKDERLKKIGTKKMAEITDQEFYDLKTENLGITSADLIEKVFPEPTWIIQNLIPEGLTILAGKPKIGKSWLALQIAADVSVGKPVLDKFEEKPKGVMFLGLEDSERRLQKRFNTINGFPSGRLVFYTEWAKGMPGLKHLLQRFDQFPDTRLIIVDTLARLLPDIDLNVYSEVYPFIGSLKKIAADYNCAIVALHHTKKSISDDYLDNVSGSNALTAAADTILELTRSRGEADGFLRASGRDIDERDIALQLVKDKGWSVLGEGAEYRMSKERRDVVEILKESDAPLSAKEIQAILDKKYGAVRMLLSRMVNDGMIKRTGRGQYESIYKEE